MSSKGEIPKSGVKTNRRRRPRKHVDDDDENRPKNDALPLEDWTNDSDTKDDKVFSALSKKIRKAEEIVKMDVWNSNDALRKAVVRSSLRLAVGEDDGSNSLLLLHEHESSLIKASRTRVKEATETKDEKEQHPRLLLATHAIRALVRFATKPATQEALLQLLYHIINTLGGGKFSNDADLIILAFEALHHILLLYTKEISGARISFDTVVRDEVFVFPIPVYKKESGTKDESNLSIDKICTIAIQSIILTSRAILARHCSNGDATLPDFLCRVHQQPLPVARHLLTTVATFWIHFQERMTRSLKDGVSHCKRIHRLLWEKASSPDCSTIESLELRQDSLCILLSGESSSLCKALACKFGDTVCTYACKASAAFVAQISVESVSEKHINCFHQKIGSLLDRVFDGRLGFSYLEYCSLRAQHVGIEPPHRKAFSASESRQMNAILRLALLSVELNRVLTGGDEASWDSMKHAKRTISEFRVSFLDDSNFGWSSEDVTRITKIIPVNSLHKSLYNFLKERTPSPSVMPALLAGALVMTRCLASFFLLAAKKNKSDRTELCGKATDCLIRGATVLELKERQSGERDETLEVSKEMFRLSSDFSLFHKGTVPHFERLAKFLSNAARKREDASFSTALSLQLIGLRLFTELSNIAETSLSSLMLSQRWACLSSFFGSNQHPDASVVAGLVSLVYDAVESCEQGEQGDDLGISLFGFVCARSRGMLDLSQSRLSDCFDISDRRRGMILRIFRILGELEKKPFLSPANQGEATALTLSCVFGCFDSIVHDNRSSRTMDHVMSTCSVPFTLSGLLRVMLPSNGVVSRRMESPEFVIVAKIKLVLDIIHEFGAALNSGIFPEGCSYQDILYCHKQMAHVAANLVGKLQDESTIYNLRPIVTSAIYFVAATAIVPFGLIDARKCSKSGVSNVDPDDDQRQRRLMSTSHSLVKSAIACLSDCLPSDSQLLAVALKPVLLYMEEEYGETSDAQALTKSMHSAMEKFANVNDSDAISPQLLGAHIMVSFLSAQSDIFQTKGEGFTALRLSEWSFRVANMLDRGDKRWLEVVYLRKLSPCTVLSNAYPTDLVIDSPESTLLDTVEVQANRIRCQVTYMTKSSETDKVCCLLASRLDECRELFHELPRNLFVQASWLRGTLTQALAQSCTIRGDLDRAILMCKEGLRLCKQALIASTRQVSSSYRISPSSSFDLTIVQRLEDRQVDLLFSLASLFQGAGDYRRAETYLYTAAKYLDSDKLSAVLESTESALLPDLIQKLYSLCLDNPRVSGFRRLIWGFAMARSSHDQLTQSIQRLQKSVDNESLISLSKDDRDLDFVLEGISRLRFTDFVGETKQRSLLWEQVRDTLNAMRSTPELSGFAKLISGAISPVPQSDLDLLEANRAWRDLENDDDFRQEIALRRTCKRILEAQFASPSQRSDALYLLGLLHLREAREEGALARLWHGHSNHEGTRLQFETECDNSLSDAKQCFSEALSLRGPASDLMTRNILRLLALVSGPEDDPSQEMASWELIHTSIGSSIRQRVRRAFISESVDDSDNQAGSELYTVLSCLDLPFFSEERRQQVAFLAKTLEQWLPHEWRTVAVALCPTGELLINLVEVGNGFDSRTVCIFPCDPSEVYDTMMQPLDKLISQNQDQLRGESPTPQSADENIDRREWWSHRERIDNELDLLFRTVEKSLFGSSNAQAVLCGDYEMDPGERSDDWATQKSYAVSSFEGESPQKDETRPATMKVTELRDELVDMGLAMKDLRKMKKAELVSILTEERRRKQAFSKTDTSLPRTQPRGREGGLCEARNSTVLVLDEDLHRFPFEALPCLRDRIVCRSPSLSFVGAKLMELNQEGQPPRISVDPKLSSFILDPESNLSSTRERIGEFLQSQSTKRGFEWKGVVGAAPTEEFVRENLVREKGMFLFFGHGGGQAYFSRSAIESLISPGERRVKASVILMGCSSGRLVSVNRKTLESPRKVPILFEPEGLALSYLAAGAPCVIGNLWDVTDRDIDRFSVELLTRFYDGQDLATSLGQARSVCKMKFLNGYAPVYYGLPVFPEQSVQSL